MRFAALINDGASWLKTADRAAFREHLASTFSARGHEITEEDAGSDLVETMKRLASDERYGGIIVAGGDGTVSLAASFLAGTDRVLGVVPCGNMNFFSRSLGLPDDPVAAVEALAGAEVAEADVGVADERIFIHEFSLGLHPEMIEERDRTSFRSRIGKVLGSWSAALRVIFRLRKLRVWVDAGDGMRPVAAAAIAVSNNPYGEGHAPYADRLDGGVLGVYIVRSNRKGDIAALGAALQSGGWQDLEFVRTMTARELELKHRGRFVAAVDGEVVRFSSPVRVSIRPRALRVLMPKATM